MNELIAMTEEMTMSTREIAYLLGKRNHDIKESAKTLHDKGLICKGTGLRFREYTVETNGVTAIEYLLNRLDSITLVAQNSPEFTAALVARWDELEKERVAKTPKTYAEALRALADQSEAAERVTQALEKKDDQFKSVRGAYGNHVMQHNKYVHSKGEGFRHATIAHVKGVITGRYRAHLLVNYCDQHNLPVQRVTPLHSTVTLNSYPAEAWLSVYEIDISEL